VVLQLSVTIAGVLLTLALSVAVAMRSTGRIPTSPQSSSSSGHPFQDPLGRYSLSLPDGWGVTMSGNEPIFRNGPSWIRIRILTANSASSAVDLAAELFRAQFTTFNTINRGNTTIAGRAAHGLNVDGITTGGQRMSVLLTAQPQGKKQYFVLVSATPVAQAPQLNSSVMVLANSVHFSGE